MIWEGNDSFSRKRTGRPEKALAQQAVISLLAIGNRFIQLALSYNQSKRYSNCLSKRAKHSMHGCCRSLN
jgi:hypothetical protein